MLTHTTRGPAAPRGKYALYCLIFVSGVAGLIYQVVWHKYLSILLGAHARATSVVLAIFMCGISAGYITFGRWSRWKPWNLLFAFCVVEILLGFYAMVFPVLFRLAMPLTAKLYASVGIDSIFIDIFVSALLIGFPTFLMGGTLPLLTQGLSESVENASSTHARIYGFNTVGACFGSLLAGYLLVPSTTLPKAVALAGFLNILVGVTTYFLYARNLPFTRTVPPAEPATDKMPLSARGVCLFAIGLLSGFYILSLETVLIRLVGLSTGSSNYNFTLIVSIFVFGLGFGSLLVRKISHYTETRLFWNQLAASAFLMLLYVSGDYWPYWVHLVRIIFRDSPQNFYLYQAALGTFFFVLLALPIGFCGLTMPLCFHLLKDKQESLGNRVGQLYGLNTLGCVLGALLGGFGLLYVINLDQLFKLCALLCVVTAALAAYMMTLRSRPGPLVFSLGSTVFTLVLIGLMMAPLYNKLRYVQPFRQQYPTTASYEGIDEFTAYLSSSTEYLYYKDGPNTSVGIGVSKNGEAERSRTIFVNGKSDGNTRGDLLTMALTGHIPGLLARKLDDVCVIGFGTGITTGSLARYKETGKIELVEIADTILKNASYFDAYNGGVSTHPKVSFNAMDAFRFMGGTTKMFDVIVSEPSNPWVAGVENLFSAEFYEIAKKKLQPDGVFVQWVQTYSFNDDLLKMVFKTITSHFPYVAVFQMLDHDIALVASRQPFTKADLARTDARFNDNRDARRALAEIGITRLETLLGYEIVPTEMTPYLTDVPDEHHLEAPKLSHSAARAFFVNSSAKIHAMRRTLKEFYPAVRTSLLYKMLDGQPVSKEALEAMRTAYCDHPTAKAKTLCEEAVVLGKWITPDAPLETTYEGVVSNGDFRSLASYQKVKKLKVFGMNDLKEVQDMFDVYKKYYSPIAMLPIAPVMTLLENCLEVNGPDRAIHGDCLLQKAAVLEIAEPENPTFLVTLHQFEDWFASLSPSLDHYTRFKKANEILSKLAREVESAKKKS